MATSENSTDDIVDVTKGLQVTSGSMFAILAIILILMNSGSVLAAQGMSREKRLNMSCAIIVFVCMFSSFFNFFQLTELDDVAIPQSEEFWLDMSRPFEWICTCPMMQLVLVILGGTAIPSYRCVLMPSLSVTVLLFGVASTLFNNSAGRVIMYVFGALTALVMFYFNFKQIGEVASKEEEGIVSGTPEFRVATLVLIITWFPFPIWYLLSPEGLSVIEEIKVIHTGWAVLNVVAKFSFIIYVQKIARDYKKSTQEQAQNNQAGWRTETRKNQFAHEEDFDIETLVGETFEFLGMAQFSQRLMNLLKKASVTSLEALDKIDSVQCQELLLPPEVIYAVQQRLRGRRSGGAEKKKKDNADSSVLTDAISAAKSPADIGKLQQAIKDAKEVGADTKMVNMARAKVDELTKWKAVKEYMTNSFNALLDGHDMAGVRDMLDVAEVAGLSDLVTKGKAKLAEEDAKEKKVSKLVQQGNAHVKNKKYADALKAYDQALDLQPDDPKTLLNRSTANRMLGNFDSAEADASRSLELRPNSAAAHRARALALQKLNRFEEAVEACDAGLALDPKDAGLLNAKRAAEENATLRSTASVGEEVNGVVEEITEEPNVNNGMEGPTPETTVGSEETLFIRDESGIIRM
mmetsp:Transcript_57860/g.106443  ORF Transcript_57860/g.106443 Transcript_57860/m.106443 type:complete len:635 (-) Transcript_57860:106-2010(-)